jgi:hypothetical protein
MSSGGNSQSAPTSQTVTQTNIPEQFLPYFERLVGRVEAQSQQPYQPYGAPRIAQSGQFGDITASREAVRGIAGAGVPGMDVAQQAAQENIGLARGLGQYAPGQFTQFGFDPARQFTGQEVQQYMSPYLENVLDVQKSRAVEDFDRLRGARNTRAVAAGAFGGSRQAVQEGLAEEALLRQMGEIEATGRQAAFEQAAQQFGADRAAQFGVQQAQAGELGRVQTGTEASRQFGAGQGLAALGAAGAEAGRLAALGEQARGAGIQGAQLLEGIGRAEQAEAQAGLDLAYQDFLRQQGYPMEQLGFYSDVLRGLPVAPASTQTQQGFQYYNPMQQALGAGISGLSLYKAFAG